MSTEQSYTKTEEKVIILEIFLLRPFRDGLPEKTLKGV